MRATRRQFLQAAGFGAVAGVGFIATGRQPRELAPAPLDLEPFDLEAMISADAAEAFARAEDEAMLRGTGNRSGKSGLAARDVLALQGELAKGYNPVFTMNERAFWHFRDPQRLDPANPRRRGPIGRWYVQRRPNPYLSPEYRRILTRRA